MEELRTWIADAIQKQALQTRLLGHHEYDEVPFYLLRDKLKNEYETIGDGNSKKWLAVEERILKENQCCTFYLKPIYIITVDKELKNSGIYIVFRIQDEKTGRPLYVDQLRTYRDWKDFLKNNTLPELLLIYPFGGNYTKETKIVVEESIACSSLRKARKITKVAAVSMAVASTVALAVVPFVPVLTPAVPVLSYAAASGGAVMGIDGAVQIKDLVTHHESMSPTNLRALDAYMDVGSACGGLLRGGATYAAKILAEDATKMAKFVRIMKVAGSTAQNISLFVKCTAPLSNEFDHQDFQKFCLSSLNIIVKVTFPSAKLFIDLFVSGIAVYRGDAIRSLVTVRSVQELFVILFVSLIPSLLKHWRPQIREFGVYLGNLACNKYRHLLPSLINFEKFALLQSDFLSLINETSKFFNVPDILKIKFNGFSMFLEFSIGVLMLVKDMLQDHFECKNNETPHPLTKPQLVELWFEFMDVIRCCSPRALVRGTHFFLDKLTSRPSELCKRLTYTKPAPVKMNEWVDEFLFIEAVSKTNRSGDKPVLHPVNGMEVYLFYSPDMGGERSALSAELKTYYREKAEIVLGKRVTEVNSEFHENGNGANAVLFLSQCQECTAVVFNRTFLENGNAILLISTFE